MDKILLDQVKASRKLVEKFYGSKIKWSTDRWLVVRWFVLNLSMTKKAAVALRDALKLLGVVVITSTESFISCPNQLYIAITVENSIVTVDLRSYYEGGNYWDIIL